MLIRSAPQPWFCVSRSAPQQGWPVGAKRRENHGHSGKYSRLEEEWPCRTRLWRAPRRGGEWQCRRKGWDLSVPGPVLRKGPDSATRALVGDCLRAMAARCGRVFREVSSGWLCCSCYLLPWGTCPQDRRGKRGHHGHQGCLLRGAFDPPPDLGPGRADHRGTAASSEGVQHRGVSFCVHAVHHRERRPPPLQREPTPQCMARQCKRSPNPRPACV